MSVKQITPHVLGQLRRGLRRETLGGSSQNSTMRQFIRGTNEMNRMIPVDCRERYEA